MGEEKERDRIEELNERFVLEAKDNFQNPKGSRRIRRQFTRRRLALLLPLILVLSVMTAQGLYNYYGPGNCHSVLPGIGGDRPSANPTKVGLVDTLAFEFPDRGFVDDVASAAHSVGLGFDYYTPSTLSLDTFVHLPVDGYSILILRTHIAISEQTTSLNVAITTSLPYDNYRWVSDQEADTLTNVNLNGSFYFGLTPQFVTQRMCGQFPRTMVLAMGCYGMNSTEVGSAFLQKGASAFVGWKGVVRVDETDTAFEKLVPMLLDGMNVNNAVAQVMGTEPVGLGQPILSYTTG